MKSPIIFRVFKNNQIHFVKQFIDKDQIVFGSSLDSGAEIDVDLESKEVSAIHCLVEKRGTQYFICDLGSSQGTYKNGQVVLDEALNTNDEFQIGPFKVVFFVGVPKPVHNQETSSELVVPSTSKPSEPPVRTTAVVTPPPPAPIVTPAATSQAKPTINAAFVGQRAIKNQSFARIKKGKNQKTFAPASEHQNLNEFIKPGQGSLVEVIVSWKERVLSTHHFEPRGQVKAGPDLAIQLPRGAAPKDWTMLDCTSGVVVRLNSDMKAEVHRAEDIMVLSESNYKLQQNEVLFVTLPNGMQLAIRFAPKTKLVPLDSPLILTSSEFTGILAALIFAVLLSLIMSVLAPKVSEQEEEVQRVAQVIFNKPPVPVNPPVAITPPPPPPPKDVPPPPPKPPEPPKKVAITDKAQEVKSKGDPSKQEQKAQAAQSSGRASEVKPKDPKNKMKMFTSTKQGGAIKTGPKAGANAQSKEPDPTNSGLLSAFGSGGARSQLDKAYSGSGEALGAGEKATGASGFNENRAGNDLGSRFKDTGAGGKGTATQGIAGIGTKGGSGYGTGTGGSGFGNKDSVAIQAGGAEEAFIGSIDKEAVRRVVRSALQAFKACYDREYKKDTKLEGKVVISWEIHEKGVAKNASVVREKSTLDNSAVGECVRARLLTLRFPEPPAGAMAEINYPFFFRGEN